MSIKRSSLGALKSPEIEKMSKERPYALQVIQTQIMYDVAGLLEELVERQNSFQSSWEETVPRGDFKPLTVPVTDQITQLKPENTPTMPWLSATMYNDGPGSVYMTINEEYAQEKTPLRSGEHLNIGLIKRKICNVYLTCAPGQTASLRIFAIR